MTDPHAPLRRTPLTSVHERLGATLTGFAGWLMPLRYGSETAEHNAVRTAAGLFDLSHMGEIMVTGPGAAAALDYALVGQPSALAPGRARYTMICAPDGGILDDLIVYRLADAEFLVVANAANTDVVVKALTGRAGAGAQVADRTDEYALIALQGPNAVQILTPLTNADLGAVKYYASYPATVAGREILLARTGYTGEDGFELFTGRRGRRADLGGADRGRRRSRPAPGRPGRTGHAPARGRDAALRQRARARPHPVRRRSWPGGQARQARRLRRPRGTRGARRGNAAARAGRARRPVQAGAETRLRRPLGRGRVRDGDQRGPVPDAWQADRDGLRRARRRARGAPGRARRRRAQPAARRRHQGQRRDRRPGAAAVLPPHTATLRGEGHHDRSRRAALHP